MTDAEQKRFDELRQRVFTLEHVLAGVILNLSPSGPHPAVDAIRENRQLKFVRTVDKEGCVRFRVAPLGDADG
jgi:hypothetical protein